MGKASGLLTPTLLEYGQTGQFGMQKRQPTLSRYL